MADHDLIIRGGRVVDGTGSPPRTADVAIDDGVITAIGNLDGTAARTIDADGLVVTPGFVDIHSHYDGQATWSDRLVPSTWHGVTTLVTGNCGVGFAPVRPADHQRLIELMEGVEDIPGAVLDEGLSWAWESFPSFLDALDGRPYDADVAIQLPHGALRLNVMGERGAAREPASADDIARMAAAAAEAVRAGALGFTTSRTLNHRTSKGEPTPTLTAGADELVGIARAIGETGAGVLQVVSDFTDVDGEFALFRRMAEESGRPLSFTLLETGDDSWRRKLELLEQARTDGVAMTAQVAPRAVGLLLGLQCSMHPFVRSPAWHEVKGLPAAEQARLMREPSLRERILAEPLPEARGPLAIVTSRFDRMFELADPPVYEPDATASFAARAAAAGADARTMVYDLLTEGDGDTMIYVPLINYGTGSLDPAGEMLAHRWSVPGLADGGAHLGSICDASFPTTLLSWWGRDRDHGRLPLEDLVAGQTRRTAETVGLLDRGVLAPGYRADVNLIDFDSLRARRPYSAADLPAGGRRLLQRADGYVATLVAGQVTYEHGEPTDALPGRLVRGSRPAPKRGPR